MTFASKKAAAGISRVVRRIFRWNRSWLWVQEVDVGILQLPAELDGYRIAQFSDLHFDGIVTTSERLRELVDTINQQQPDLIAFTGDFITMGIPFQIEDLTLPLRDLHARDGKVAIMGNHDHRFNTGLIRRVIQDSGMIDLNNAVYTIQHGAQSLHICGVDSLKRRQARLDLVMRDLPETGTAILLAHEPNFSDVSAATGRFVLQLSGHTHGGQIRLPFLTPFMLRSVDARYLYRGMRVDTMVLYINRGIGMVGLPIRVRCPSELTIIRLRSVG
jgi:predicted MPP superfamily phosphohydrolase